MNTSIRKNLILLVILTTIRQKSCQDDIPYRGKPHGCSTYTNRVCLACKDGWSLVGTICRRCSKGCGTCDSSGCKSCSNGYFGTSSTNGHVNCNRCVSSCKRCRDGSTCSECILLYTKSSGGGSCQLSIWVPIVILAGICAFCILACGIAAINMRKARKAQLRRPPRRNYANPVYSPGRRSYQSSYSSFDEVGYKQEYPRHYRVGAPAPVAYPQPGLHAYDSPNFPNESSFHNRFARTAY